MERKSKSNKYQYIGTSPCKIHGRVIFSGQTMVTSAPIPKAFIDLFVKTEGYVDEITIQPRMEREPGGMYRVYDSNNNEVSDGAISKIEAQKLLNDLI